MRPGGIICVKDNCFSSERRDDGSTEIFTVDRDDSSVTRSTEYFETLFKYSNLKIIRKEKQTKFPSELFPVYMYALSPESSVTTDSHNDNIAEIVEEGCTNSDGKDVCEKKGYASGF